MWRLRRFDLVSPALLILSARSHMQRIVASFTQCVYAVHLFNRRQLPRRRKRSRLSLCALLAPLLMLHARASLRTVSGWLLGKWLLGPDCIEGAWHCEAVGIGHVVVEHNTCVNERQNGPREARHERLSAC